MPEIPEGAKTPQDHKTKTKKAKKPKRADTVAIEFRGVTYQLPAEIADDIDIAEALEGQRYFAALSMIMGPMDYAKFKQDIADDKGRTKASDVTEFATKVMEKYQALKG